ncbi:CLUMA_CG012969, isoform A [Clunio marinus]|uniref:CLUMA_CG012969, isoform A n=1 Tax=Clunio marinus TaxID=568069 RepID=A0A1J1IHL4_9DIPT|nr:CLUMA_CG012969, isoform A [Clunio marinus]
MSQDRPSSRDGTSKIMSHVLMQTSPIQYATAATSNNINNNNNNINNNNLILNKNNFLTIETSNNISNTLIHNKNSCSAMLASSSATNSILTPSVNYITTTTNVDGQNEVNGSQIVLLANENLEPSDNEQTPDTVDRKVTNGATDEELTPLHWLHDKNLLKGINLSCPKVQSPSETNERNAGGRTSTAGDSIDDSGVSEDNNSIVNSSSEHNGHSTSPSSPKPLNYTTTDNNSSNLLINSLSSVKSLEKNSQNSLSNTTAVVTSTTSNDINMKSAAGLSNNSLNNSLSSLDHYQSSNLSSEESINQIIKTPQTPHQHFHKKYLRETLKQQDEEKKQQQQEQMHIQNAHMSSYIITKNQSEGRYIYADERDIIANYNNNNNNNNIQSNYEKSHEYDLSQKIIDYATPKSTSYSSGSSIASSSSSSPSPKQKQHPNNIPYDPLVHTASKPPYSFSSLIFMAIEDSLQKALPVKEIYAWIIQHFPYFKTAPTGWKNSVRHNLSLNKCFQKVEKAASPNVVPLQNLGKGSLWMVEPQYRPNLIQALTRSPFHPCSTWEKHAKNLIKTPSESPGSKQSNGSARLPNPEHFPFLSRRLAAAMESYDEEGQSRASTPSTNYEVPQNYSTNGMVIYQNNNSIIINGNIHNSELMSRELNAETIDDVNAATAMLALKHGPKIFTEGIPFAHPPIITTSPSEDHTYSAFTGGKNGTDNNSNGTSSDAAYESSEESPNVVYQFSQPLNEKEMEEQRRQAEGVDALLNLAGYNTSTTLLLKRPASVDEPQQFEKKQYFYTTEIAPSNQYHSNDYYTNEPPTKKTKSRILRNKLKKKPWYR